MFPDAPPPTEPAQVDSTPTTAVIPPPTEPAKTDAAPAAAATQATPAVETATPIVAVAAPEEKKPETAPAAVPAPVASA